MACESTRSPRVPLSVWLLVLMFAAAAGHLAYYYPRLPDTVASHFGASGQPNDWSSKGTYTIVILAITGVLALTFLGIGALLRRLPDDMINFPNRDYWLAPARRDESLEAFARMLHGFGAATIALLIAMNHLVFDANLRPPVRLGAASWLLIAVYLAFAACWTIMLYRRFRVDTASSTG